MQPSFESLCASLIGAETQEVHHLGDGISSLHARRLSINLLFSKTGSTPLAIHLSHSITAEPLASLPFRILLNSSTSTHSILLQAHCSTCTFLFRRFSSPASQPGKLLPPGGVWTLTNTRLPTTPKTSAPLSRSLVTTGTPSNPVPSTHTAPTNSPASNVATLSASVTASPSVRSRTSALPLISTRSPRSNATAKTR